VATCNTIKDRALKEKAANAPNAAVFSALAETNTKVGQILSQILGKITVKDIEAAASMTATDVARLGTLNKTLAERAAGAGIRRGREPAGSRPNSQSCAQLH